VNPWGFVAIGVGILLIIIGVTGSYENVKAAITGHASTTAKASTAPAPGVKLL
jgi:hypothetical protein